MQPGKPQGFGTVGEDATPIFTLPGNPVSSYVSFEVFVRPALRRMMGLLPYSRPLTAARCIGGFTSAPGRRQFLRGMLTGEPGQEEVRMVGGPGSHLVAALGRSNCLVVVPEDVTSVHGGETVDVLALDRDS
jgi:molybdopterin molybdotransferase